MGIKLFLQNTEMHNMSVSMGARWGQWTLFLGLQSMREEPQVSRGRGEEKEGMKRD